MIQGNSDEPPRSSAGGTLQEYIVTRHKPFARGLTEDFMRELIQGRFTPLLSASLDRGLDLQIRENYINVYASGRSVLQLRERGLAYEANIHRTFRDNTLLADTADRQYRCFAADDAFVMTYLSEMGTVISNALATAKSEAAIEEHMIRRSCLTDSPVVFLDRQIQTHGIRKRLDLVALSCPCNEEASVILVEIKQGLDNRIQELMTQIREYHDVFAPGGGLRQDVTSSYQTVVHQKKQLGVIPDNVTYPSQPPRVECLLVLYAYNPKSRLLDRLRESARSSALRPKLVLIEEGCYGLPPSEEWEQL